jgi:hypothetical protein
METPQMRDYKKVLVATPCRDGKFHATYTNGLLQSTGLYGGWLPMAGQSDIYVARNTLANQFLQQAQFDTIVWIDSDIGFTRNDLKQLLDSTEPVVSGLYTDKCQPPRPFCRSEEGAPIPDEEIPPVGMIETSFLPGGFLKIERYVYQAIIDQKLAPEYGGINGLPLFWQFYNGRIFKSNLLSEDYSFSYMMREAGFQCWIDCGIRLNHDGRTYEQPVA